MPQDRKGHSWSCSTKEPCVFQNTRCFPHEDAIIVLGAFLERQLSHSLPTNPNPRSRYTDQVFAVQGVESGTALVSATEKLGRSEVGRGITKIRLGS